MISAYINGIKNTLQNKKMITLVYLSTLFLGLLIAIPFFGFAKSTFSSSLLLGDLLKDFDYTAYSTFTNNYDEAISIFTNLIRWFGIGYLFFSIFLSGGILSTFILNDNNFTIKSFLSNCGEYFGRFFRLAIYQLIVVAIFFLGFASPYSMIISAMADTVQNEAVLVYTTVAFLVSFLLVLGLVITIGDYTKITLIKDDTTKVIKTLWASVKFVFNNFQSFLLYLLTLVFPAAITAVYLLLESAIGMTSGITILLMIVIQQLFVWTRILGKVWVLASAVEFNKGKYLKIETDIEDEDTVIPEEIRGEVVCEG